MENSTQDNSLNDKNEAIQKIDENISKNLDTIAFYLLEAIKRKLDNQSQKKGA
ncbi:MULTISPECIES: hypothetical protein [Bacillaceae]|uniref:hypothetical protein n=1 Tax=Bacillaceae TaxID=186817 RepID=UPI000A7E4077|nr:MULTISPECIES: hypothetical protein [Bacillaceae]